MKLLVEESADRVGTVEERGGDGVEDFSVLVVSGTRTVLLYTIVSESDPNDLLLYIQCSGSCLESEERTTLGCAGPPPVSTQIDETRIPLESPVASAP